MSLAARIAARYQGQGLVNRVASRYVEAFEFSSDKERSRYLREHPDADPSRHTVKKQPQKPGKAQPPPKPGQPGKKPPPLPEQHGKPEQPVQKGKPPAHGEKPPQQHGGHPEEHAEHGHGEHDDEEEGHDKPEQEPDFQTPGRKVVEGLKGLSSGAVNFLKKAPAAVQKFFNDEGHRRAVLTNLHGAISAAPKKFKDNLIQTAKHEGHEFKLAGQGIESVMDGKKMSKKQKNAVKQVAIHMGITTVAAAISATGVGAGLAFAAKALARHIALKSVHRTFAHVDTASELHHIGHGILELMDKFASRKAGDQNRDPYDVLAAIVMRSVQEELANLSDDDLKAMLEQMSQAEGGGEEETDEEEPSEDDEEEPSDDEEEEPADETEGEPEDEEDDLNAGGMTKEASALMSGPEVADLCEQAETVHKSLRAWIRSFPVVLKKAKDTAAGLEADPELVWQDEFGPYWKGIDHPLEVLADIDEKLEDIYLRSPTRALVDVANSARNATNDRLIPAKARIEYAFGNPQFRDHPDRRSHIAYTVSRLEDWARTFEDWTDGSIGALHQGARKARRAV